MKLLKIFLQLKLNEIKMVLKEVVYYILFFSILILIIKFITNFKKNPTCEYYIVVSTITSIGFVILLLIGRLIVCWIKSNIRTAKKILEQKEERKKFEKNKVKLSKMQIITMLIIIGLVVFLIVSKIIEKQKPYEDIGYLRTKIKFILSNKTLSFKMPKICEDDVIFKERIWSKEKMDFVYKNRKMNVFGLAVFPDILDEGKPLIKVVLSDMTIGSMDRTNDAVIHYSIFKEWIKEGRIKYIK